MTSTASSFRIHGLLRLGAIALGLLILQPALARKDDRQKPMNVEHADSFEGFNAPNSITTLHGHVVLSQGTLKITGDLARIHFDADQNVSRIEITGTPAHIQQLDDSGNLMTGDSAKLDYDNNQGIAVLSGNAVVKQQGRGEAHGDKLTYNTETAQMSGSSGSDGMVHMTFLPKPRSAPAPTSAPAGKPAAASTATPAATPAPVPAASSATPQGHR